MTLQQRHGIHYLSSVRGQVAQIHPSSSSLLHSSYLVACSANDNSHLSPATADVAHAPSPSLTSQYTWADVKLQNWHLVPEEFFPITTGPSAHVHYRPEEPGTPILGVTLSRWLMGFAIENFSSHTSELVCFTLCPKVSL